MRTFLTPLALATTLLVGAAAPAWADFWDGIAAYEAGDYATALKEFRPLAAQGHVLSQNNLGAMYFDGRGVPQDDAEAVKWYRLAAAQGIEKPPFFARILLFKKPFAIAQHNLALMYHAGRGVPQDYAEAKRSSAGPPCTSISQVPMRSVLFMPFLDPQLTAYEDEPDFC